VLVSPDCIAKFNELKLNKKLKFIIYKLSDDYKEIVIEETSENSDWDFFREKLLSAQSKSKTVCLTDSMFQLLVDM
jgi:enolase